VLDTVQVQTPDQSLNLMINTWLPYQSISCRIRARAAFYQASGAFGFRDQLQDSLAFLLQMPDLAKEQIIAAAGRQFLEGDVQHWWLPQTGAGVRTRIADDVVWLAYGVAHYISVTDDEQILETPIAFLEGQALEPGQSEAFFQPEKSSQQASLYEHCARALDLAIERTGSHNLPLILGGDWNDGMNRVGAEGRGESVWLGWFLAHTLNRFLPIADAQGDTRRQSVWQQHLQRLVQALENAGWDGNYYRRGYYDDGTPLGSAQSLDCQIDSIAQSWSVLSDVGNTQRSHQAMDEVLDKLVDDQAQLIKLFTPAFDDGPAEPGYIKGYPPGVRENGGQYTHAATWVVCALAQLGRGDDAYRCLQMLNPVNHALTQAAAETYRVEPYVVAADVYSGADRTGRGGWTWYTGSSGWLYRAAVEYVLGIRRKGNTLIVQPVLPTHWEGFSATVQIEGQTYDIRVSRDADAELLIYVNEVAISCLQDGFPLS
jgi:cyclic beta-1,2-glucan synthetase